LKTLLTRHSSLEEISPVERWFPLSLKLALYFWLTYFFYQAATTFYEYQPGQHWPFLLSIFRTFTFLPLHEGGHFLFMFFGRTLHILGGSFWQIMFMVLWFIIALRQKSHVAPFALFWVGENMMDVSLYMRDAPRRWLPLLGGHKAGHDWYNLFTDWNMMDSAETFADVFYFGGFIISAGAIAAGVYLAIQSFFKQPTPQVALNTDVSASPLDESLDSIIEKTKKPLL